MTRVNLSIFNFRKSKHKKYLLYGSLLVLFVSINILINEVLAYMVIDDSKSYTRIMMHEFYHSQENIDVLYLGSSHCYRSINPEISDKLFDKNTFNAGSSKQSFDASYALLVYSD